MSPDSDGLKKWAKKEGFDSTGAPSKPAVNEGALNSYFPAIHAFTGRGKLNRIVWAGVIKVC
jgi:hypothetical protein